MAARIRTLNFLPEVFRTPTNAQFLGATLDQVVDQPNTMRVEGYIGSRFGYGINAKDKYVVEPTKTRTDYQLDPGVVFTKTNTSIANDFISYPGIIDAVDLNGGISNNNDRLFQSQFYSWDPFVNLDKLINFNEYYWLPEGAPSVPITTDIVYNITDYTVTDLPNGYNISSEQDPGGAINPTITLIRGGTYTFTVNQNSSFWIQGKPGITGLDPSQPNVQTRDVLGVSNNGANIGVITFNVPFKDAQDEYNFPGNNLVDVVSTTPFDLINGKLLSEVQDIDGVTALEGLTVMFYNTGVVDELGFVGPWYDTTAFDEDGGNPYTFPGTTLDDTNYEGGYYTDVSAIFYRIIYEGDPSNPVIKLIPDSNIPTNEKITPLYGTQWKARNFYRNVQGVINLVPYLSSLLDTLYYQDGTTANKVGIIKLIDSNTTNQINILDILGKKNYTSPNGVVFTNGLKVSFDGNIFPESYKTGEYYVEGVGTAIELINTADLIVPEPFTEGTYVPYDTTPYDIGNYDVTLYIPVRQDYITISRNSIDRNPWSRSNRWFHIEVINATAGYLNDPTIATDFATRENKAKRPIIEFYPNLKLFDNCIVGKQPVDFFDQRTTDAFTQVAGKENYYPDVEVYTAFSGTINGVVSGTSTTITIPLSAVTGSFQVGQYITDSNGILPRNTTITNITGTTTLAITVTWANATTLATTTNLSFVANDISNDNYKLYDGARIVFSVDENPEVRNKIYVVRFSKIDGVNPVITLTESEDGLVLPNQGTFAFKGYYNTGKDFYYYYNNDPLILNFEWQESQQKTLINQAPLFDIFDNDGISYGDKTVYVGSSFRGNKLFSYGIGTGLKDSILGFPLRYSSVSNVGDVSFDVPLNSATFDYVTGSTPVTQNVNTGYVYNYSSLTAYTRELGWKTAVAESRQYQIFTFNYLAISPTNTFVCDVALAIDTIWPNIQLYVNNVLQDKTSYTYVIGESSTTVTFDVPNPETDTIIEIAVLSDQVSDIAYYQVPVNLSNNPFNADITTVNVGDIRGQYQSIFYNNPNTTGIVFGSNNYRDLGNLVPWGNKIIQNSASLVLPGTFFRKTNSNLVDALQYNSNQYILFKALLMDTVNSTNYTVYQTAAVMLDDALDQITMTKSESGSFFWSDMLPSKSAYITNTYTFANSLDISRYPLSKIYDFSKANYNGILVYLTRTVDNNTTVTQLINGVDYTVSSTSPVLTVETDLIPNDIITIKEYNQTYGSYVPNTPTKLGLYPAFIPNVVLDENYTNSTYFIRGHDGSYTKLYGDYVDGQLIDFRDKVLLEFEKRIFNNLKLSSTVPIREYDVLPGFFRNTDYSYDEILSIYSKYFLNWVGQNKVEYKLQLGYTPVDQFSFNYNQSGNKIDKAQILQGYWRGIYQYFFDTSQPDVAPWEMLGFANQPIWWSDRYGPAPYTSDNLVLWGDLAAGVNWNNGDPVVIPQCVRPELLEVIPVDSQGNLLSPFDAIVGNYNSATFRNNWKVGDVAPAEFSYRRSSSWPFDLMKILSLTKPAIFYNLGVDLDNYKYNSEFNQYLVNDRSHLVISEIEIYGSGTAKTSYINWIVDYEKQVGINATQTITDILDNLDVRLIYRLAGFSDKSLLNFYVEKGTPNSRNASLLIPTESYGVLLYDNVPFTKLVYSSVIVQNSATGWKVFGNSQNNAYFIINKPKFNGNVYNVTIEDKTVKVANDYYENTQIIVPYGTEFVSEQEVAQFLGSYGNYLETQGIVFDQIESGVDINWRQMVAEFLYWSQSGWGEGSLVNINPAANILNISKEGYVVQPLTLQRQNFILNQNLYPIQSVDLSVVREGVSFTAKPLNQGDTVAFGQFNISNLEHGVVFDNITLFNDVIYNLITGLRQNRITLRGTKSAEWNGTLNAQGFILNQDNILKWNSVTKYTKGSIVEYKNKYWIAIKVIEPSLEFDSQYWKETDYENIQKGLLPNPSTRSYESTIYYDTNRPNLSKDADLLSWSLIGYRPRDYLALADLTDITQVNIYKNLIKEKGTRIATENFKGIQLPQGGIDYEVYENWAIKTGEYGGVLDNNYIDFKLDEGQLTGNPSIVGLTKGVYTEGVQQEVPLYSIFNYGRPITDPNILRTVSVNTPNTLYPDAGYVNFNDIAISGYFYNDLNSSQTPLSELYVGKYVWIADYNGTWRVYTPISIGQVVEIINNFNGTITVVFAEPHGLVQFQPFAIINFADAINGYRLVLTVLDLNRVVINLPLTSTINRLTGAGIGMKFQLQRINQPSEINNLPLLSTEFVKNKVWVDTNDTGNWAVYRKSINYQYDLELTKENSLKFGSAVATSEDLGYLISDNELGEVYRYVYSPVFDRYDLTQTLVGLTSFGSKISYAGNIFAISQPTGPLLTDRLVKIYQLEVSLTANQLNLIQTITAKTGVTNWGGSLEFSGDGNWLYIGAYEQNTVYVYRKSQVDNLYYLANVITNPFLVAGDKFGFTISTNYFGDTLVISAPERDSTVDNTGVSFVYERLYQNFEAQYTSLPFVPQTFELIFTPSTLTVTGTSITSNYITVSNILGLEVGMPIIFTGTVFGGVSLNSVYYIYDIVGSTIAIVLDRSAVSPLTLTNSSGTMSVVVQNNPLYVSVNGTLINDNDFAITNSTLNVYRSLNAGDIITVSGSSFILIQTFTASGNVTVGEKFGYSADMNNSGTELLIGSPYQISNNITEGAIYRFTDGGGKYGIIEGTEDCYVNVSTTILLNGYAVQVPAGNAVVVANAITSANITNVTASAVNNKLIISLINNELAIINDKLDIVALSSNIFEELGITKYTYTQLILDPHLGSRTQFGSVIKFDNNGSFITSAPVSSRYELTTFDSTDDENYDNDTLFDNNTTQFIDRKLDAGAVYMFDYVNNYNESLNNVGQFVYAQSLNAQNQEYGLQPYYGTALDFNNNNVIIGAPNFKPNQINGQVIIYQNSIGVQNWSVFRQSSQVVDTSGIQNVQIYSALTNNTLVNLDYIDPLQGKILGAVAQNIDVTSNSDPATYNSPNATITGSAVWGARQVGQLWFNTSTTKFVNYHQNDVVYNSKWWGRVFPGSTVTVYSWITSNVLPINYTGPGTPFDIENYSIEYVLDSTGAIVPVYFYWVRNTNIVFTQLGKTLSDTICENYISSPQTTGIAYFTPLLPNAFGLYNAGTYINDNTSVLHIGFATGTNDDVSHSVYSLIRSNYADDFLPGLPGIGGITRPESLYNRMLESLSGCSESGAVVPDPYLPKPVQSGILTRPRQSFFYNRFNALKNYLTLANETLKEIPFAETSTSLFLFRQGETNPSNGQPFYDTENYWSYVNWWAPGYSDNTRSALLVQFYYQLAEINAQNGLIVTVNQNGAGLQETYIYNSETSTWNRIGLQNGTIEFSSDLWNYAEARLGFGDNFFDTTPFDTYPSEETRNIIRFLNEDIPDELFLFRNKGLILLFNYIVSETIESQNYLPWLNKTSFIDVAHKIRELLPLEVFQSDNQDFLAGYINEVKPYHVVVKDFLFKYTGENIYTGNLTDFDLPATYSTVYQQYITPQLVNNLPNNEYQYQPTNAIWQQKEYVEWFNNFGVSITGVDNYPITKLASYVNLSSSQMSVDNVFGFPINGVITIGNEQIAYSSVDRAYSTLNGLTRGVGGTPIENHLPGEQIFIDLPAIVVLNGGRGYDEPPLVTAYIDTSIYPAPRRSAILKPVMNLDQLLRIDVVDPGDGYQVLPEILIEPSSIITFASTDVALGTSTIAVQNQLVQTGDLVKYYVTNGTTPLGNVKDGQYYYVGVLESVPQYVIALYTSYANAIQDRDRVRFLDAGSGTNNKLAISARASCVTSATPIRENNITLRFDRTTYTSQVTTWAPGDFYGSFYAGTYTNSEQVASSAISLYSTQPPIESILASAAGAYFEIQSIRNDEVVEWSSRTRIVTGTVNPGGADPDLVTIIPSEGGTPFEGFVGPTTGFYIGMPIKFSGAAFGGLTVDTVYYVSGINGLTQFSLEDENGNPISLTTASAPTAGLIAIIGEVTNTAIVTIQYPGILIATATNSTNNAITVPLLPSGIGGTQGFYQGIPVFFVGSVFGNIIENETYYITTVIDEQNFTLSTNKNPTIIVVEATEIAGNYIVLNEILDLEVNDPIIVTNMQIAGVNVTDFGGVQSGQLYYVASIDYSTNKVTFSLTENGGAITITSNVVAASNTSGVLTSQTDVVQLTSATGNMSCNVGLPISPGQINGQEFTFYQTSGEFTDGGSGLTGTNSNLLTRNIVATVASDDYIYLNVLTGGTTNIYVNMPFEVTISAGGLVTGTTYYVLSLGTIDVEVTNSSSSTNEYTCASTAGFYTQMPISFRGGVFGGITELVTYYVDTVVSGTNFTISDMPGGSTFVLTTNNGLMDCVGDDPYITVSTSIGGSIEPLTDSLTDNVLEQSPTSTPSFFVGYVLGGYTVIVNDQGSGFAYNNIITIPGADITNGVTGINDVILSVSDIGTNGEIVNVSASGTPPGPTQQYYLRVISENELAVYNNSLMTDPVNGNDLLTNYTGVVSTTVTAVNSSGNITVNDSTNFAVDDPVVFTGNIIGNIVLGQTYYILTIVGNTITISEDISGVTFNPGSSTGLDFTIAKSGDYLYLPEPFFFNQSIVKYNNKVYQCIVSNNDDEFIIGKWELMDSGDRKLNAMDRVIGYYQPNVNMPGVDLSQLFEGITYPNSTYKGNPFPPDEEFILDTVLQDESFYPTNLNSVSVIWDGSNFITGMNSLEYSGTMLSETGDTWAINKVTNSPVSITNVSYSGTLYVLTSNNSATPIFISQDALLFTTSGGVFTPFSSTPYDSTPYDFTSLFVESTSLNAAHYNNNVWVAVGENIVLSTDGYYWAEIFALPYSGTLTDVTYLNTGFYENWVAIGNWTVSGVDRAVILESNDGYTWNEINAGITTSITNATINAVSSGNGIIVIVADNGRIFTTTNFIVYTEQTSGVSENLNDIIYTDGVYIAVGDNGTILTSTDTISWNVDTSNTTENLNSVTTNNIGKYLVVGNNNVILTSLTSGINKTWIPVTLFVEDPIIYNVKGDEFTAGYGPEELVPGLISDNLTMIVSTRPGTNWPVGLYGHTGFNVYSIELTPVTLSQTEFSFLNTVENPVFLSVFEIDFATGLATRIYDFTIDWITKDLNLSSPLSIGNKLQINVYEVGNGDQLQKSNSQTIPFIVNSNTGFTELLLSCNYSAPRFNGSGLIIPGTEPKQTTCTATQGSTNSIVCDDVSIFTLNEPITFQGTTFGGIANDQTYYVKTVSFITSTITVALPPLISGIAGPTFPLTSDSGSMEAIIQTGTGAVYTDPIVVHNGSQLVLGETSVVTQTKSSTNSIVINTSVTIDVGDSIVFGDNTFGGLTSFYQYTVYSIVDNNEFTVEDPAIPGSPVTLTDASGITSCITNDYAIALQNGSTKAKLVFANSYSQSSDFITFSVFGETEPIQYGFSVPETEIFTITTGETSFALTKYLGGDNPNNAIVEYNGLRLVLTSDYTIDAFTDVLNLNFSTVNGDVVAITTYNQTERQYLNTTFGGTFSGSTTITLTIGSTSHYETGFDEVTTAGSFEINQQYVIDTIGTTDFTLIGAASNTPGLAFIATGIGSGTGTAYVPYDSGLLVDATDMLPGLIYVIETVGTTDYTTVGAASNTVGLQFTATGPAAGNGTVVTGGLFNPNLNWCTLSSGDTSGIAINSPITFSSPIGGIVAGQTYYIKQVINSTDFSISESVSGEEFELYDDTGSMTGFINPPVVANIVNINNNLEPVKLITSCSATTSGTNEITCVTTVDMLVNDLVIFKDVSGTGFGNILTDGQVYYIDTITSGTTFTVKDQYGTQVILSNAAGVMVVYVGGREAVQVTTGVEHNLTENNLIRLDGIIGSVELNNQTFYAKIIDNYTLWLYQNPYDPLLNASNTPVTSCSVYASGGYVWLNGQFTLTVTSATDTSSVDNSIVVNSVDGIVIDTPVYFSGNVFGGIVSGTKYYVKSINIGLSKITISETYQGEEFVLSTDSGTMGVSMWEQSNVDRIWVTVNGYRVPSSLLRINPNNNLSILTTIVPGDVVIITNMIPTATPNDEIYIQNVTKSGSSSVYRANDLTTTWLVQPLKYTDTVVYVQDVTKITNTLVQNEIAPAPVDGIISIGLEGDKNTLTQVIVRNNTTSTTLPNSSFYVEIEDIAPILKITANVTVGDSLTITLIIGNLIYVDGEQIYFAEVDFVANTLSGLQRGTNGTGTQTLISKYSRVYGIISTNKLPEVYYGVTWNSYVYNPIIGDPLQISDTFTGIFLNTDNT